MEASDIEHCKIVSLNVRGLNKSIKRRSIFRWFHKQNAHFYMLQETYSDKKTIAMWESEWGGKIVCNHGTKHSKGVMILINPKYDAEIVSVEKDNNGRLIILDIKINDSNVILINIYAPNDSSQQVQFFHSIQQKLENYADENIIIGGDFNCPLSALDKLGGRAVDYKKSVIDKISQLSTLYSLQDVWRMKNSDKKQFSWRNKSFKVQCRLDYFLTSTNLVKLCQKCELTYTPYSDHSAVVLTLKSESLNKKRGPGFWKFNASLLEDNIYTGEIQNNIKAFREQYDYVEDKGLKWDLIKMEIRGFTIAYSKKLAKNKRDSEKILLSKLNNLMAQAENVRNNSQLRIDIHNTQEKLKKITERKVKGAMLRSKVRWFEQRQKKYKVFFKFRKKTC